MELKSNPEKNHAFEEFDYLKWCQGKILK